MSFKNKILFLAIIITFVPLLLSYLIFISSKLTDINENIKNSLREVGYSISNSELIKEKLNTKIKEEIESIFTLLKNKEMIYPNK